MELDSGRGGSEGDDGGDADADAEGEWLDRPERGKEEKRGTTGKMGF